MAKDDIPITELRRLLSYDSEAGTFIWLSRSPDMFSSEAGRSQATSCAIWNTRYAGRSAFISDNGCGHLRGRIWDSDYMAHRVAWAIFYGEWPNGHIDHINGDRNDNRVCNLRVASNRENSQNQTFRGGSSRFKGVCYLPARNRWLAYCSDNEGRRRSLKTHATEEAAARAYNDAATRYHGEFARLNPV
jgi:hypothetical protein